jgi:hypothetical protein
MLDGHGHPSTFTRQGKDPVNAGTLQAWEDGWACPAPIPDPAAQPGVAPAPLPAPGPSGLRAGSVLIGGLGSHRRACLLRLPHVRAGAITEPLRPWEQEVCFRLEGECHPVVEGTIPGRCPQRSMRP